MSKPILDSISPGFKALSAQFSAAGLNVADFLSAAPTALKEHIAAQVSALSAQAQKDAALAAAGMVATELRTVLAVPAEQDPMLALSTLVASHASVTAQLAAAGIKFESPETLKAALDSRISMRAGEELAKRGLAEFPEQQISKDPTTQPAAAVAPKLTGLSRTQAAFAQSLAAARIQNN
jgi:hypothetical protein